MNKLSASIKCIKDLLEEHGIAYTEQRKEILSLFIVDPRHYKPNEIFKILRHKGIGIATVYRTLELLKNSNIIKEIGIGKDRYYEFKKNQKECLYVHFKCECCGNVFDYYDSEAADKVIELANAVEQKMQVCTKDITIMVSGLCNKCSR